MPLKRVVVAFACHPEKGSEEGVGWAWVTHLVAMKEFEVVYVANSYIEVCKANGLFQARGLKGFVHFDPGSVWGKKMNRWFFKPIVHFLYRRWLKCLKKTLISMSQNSELEVYVCTYVGFRFLNELVDERWSVTALPVGGVLSVDLKLISDLSLFYKLSLWYRNYSINRALVDFKAFQWSHQFNLDCVASGQRSHEILKNIVKSSGWRSEIVVDDEVFSFTRSLEPQTTFRLVLGVNASTIGPLKGIGFIIDLLLYIQRTLILGDTGLSRIKLVLIGRLHCRDEQKLRTLVKDIEIKGLVSREESLKSIAQIDVLLHFSYLDLTSTAVAEACALGVPVLCFDDHEMSSAVINGINGWRLSPDLPYQERVACAAKYLCTLSDRAVLKRFRLNSKAIAKARFSQTSLGTFIGEYFAVRR